jgi:branched-chain amino acid transport system substrate-binding protein
MRLNTPGTKSRSARVFAAAVTIAVGSFALAACGSNEGGSSGGGDSFTLGLITTEQSQATNLSPYVRPNAEAAVKAINDAGGIAGKKVKLKVCDQHFTSSGSAACWQQFSADKSLIAVVGGTDCFSDASAKIIESSKLPVLGRSACGLTDYTNKQMFFMIGGVPVDSRALGLLAPNETVALIRYDLPAADAIQDGIEAGLQEVGGKIIKVVNITPTTSDLSAAASAAIAAKADVIIPFVNQSQATASIKQIEQLGYAGKIVVSQSVLSNTALASLGSAADGIVGEAAQYPADATGLSGPIWDQYRSELKAAGDDKPDYYRDFSTWLSFRAFKQIAEGNGVELTRDGILKALEAQTNFEFKGTTPAFDLAGSVPGPIKGGPRITNPWVAQLIAQGGQWKWDGKWLNAFDPTKSQ